MVKQQIANPQKAPINPQLIIFIGILGISCSSIFIKLAAAPALITAFYRLFFTVIILTPFFLRLLIKNKESTLLNFKQLSLSFLAGVFLALHFAFWFTSLDYTTISSSTVIVALNPLFVMLGGYFFYSESLNVRVLLGAMLAIVGSMVLGYGDFDVGGNALLGDFLALAGAIFVACYVLVGRGVRKKIALLPYIYIVYFSGSLVLLLGSMITRQPLTGYPFDTWVWFVALAVVSTIFGQSFFSWALKYVKAVAVSISILGEPVGATLLAFIIWKQIPDFLQVVGGILIIFGLAIFIRFSQPSNQNERASRRPCSKRLG